MQKAKKMSKQTLVVAVLAILLVLSLALSVTGAWFTDRAEDTNTADVSFATVSVGVTKGNTTFKGETVTSVSNALPGDEISFAGKIDNGNSTVKIYLGVLFSELKLTATTADGSVYDVTSIATITDPTVADIVAEDETFADGHGLIYVVDVAADKQEYNYSAKFTFKGADMKNYVANATKISGDGAATANIVLNAGAYDIPDGALTATFELTLKVEVLAVQFDNLADAQAAADVFDGMPAIPEA